MTILSRIYEQVRKNPDRFAFINQQQHLTYRELWEQSDALSAWMLQHNGPDPSPVIVYGHKQPLMPVCFMACAKLGRAYIPVDASTPVHRIRYLIEQTRAPLMLAPAELPGGLGFDFCKIVDPIDLAEILMKPQNLPMGPEQWSKGDETFYMIYTSGSTGNPKGVQISEANLSSFVDWMLKDFDIGEGQIYLNQAPLSFDLSVMDLYPSLTGGGTVWSVDRDLIADPRRLFSLMKSAAVNVWVSTPSFAEFCLMESTFCADDFPDLRTFLFCGEALSHATAKQLMARFPRSDIYNLYGPTEATVAVTAVKITSGILERYASLPVGYVKPGCKIHILGQNNEPLSPGEKGEIVITGPSVSKGYCRNSEAHPFFPFQGEQAYRTGDIGYFSEGMLFFAGRIDYQIKLQGYRIELEDIEENLRKVPTVLQAAVMPKLENGKCEYLAAFIVAEPEPARSPLTRSLALKKALAQQLPAYMIPRKILFKETLPMTANGKINRAALAEEV